MKLSCCARDRPIWWCCKRLFNTWEKKCGGVVGGAFVYSVLKALKKIQWIKNTSKWRRRPALLQSYLIGEELYNCGVVVMLIVHSLQFYCNWIVVGVWKCLCLIVWWWDRRFLDWHDYIIYTEKKHHTKIIWLGLKNNPFKWQYFKFVQYVTAY